MTQGEIGLAFDESVWQSGRAAAQISLYKSLDQGGAQGAEVATFVGVMLKAAGRGLRTGSKMRLVVERRLTLSHGETNIEVVLSRPGASQIPSPKNVVPYEEPGSSIELWLHYPTSYSFLDCVPPRPASGVSDPGLPVEARLAATDALDAHLDEFMANRAKLRRSIESKIDELDREATVGHSVAQLPSVLHERLVKAALAGEFTIFKALPTADRRTWIDSSTVSRVQSSLFVEIEGEDGATTDIEVP
ncbi:MAG: hypothetical protein ACYC96_06450 [Fimbriimonadaceae bacterium]